MNLSRETLSEEFAGFLRDLEPQRLPEEVREDARWRFIDTVGVAIGGTQLDFAPSLLTAAKTLHAPGVCTVLGTSIRLLSPGAGFANGALAHGADFDDTHVSSIIHVSAVVVPTALAIGECLGASGASCATAAIGGAEVGIRVGLPAGVRFQAQGFHPTSICGPFAATATVAKLLDLSHEQTVNALGLASSHAGGLLQGVLEGAWAKRLHPGLAVRAGIECAVLAKRGISGPRCVFEGEAGLYRALLRDDQPLDMAAARSGLGERWLYPHTVYKPFPSAAWTHSSLSGLAGLLIESRLKAEEIAAVECRLPPSAVPIVFDAARARNPASPYHMKNSLPYVLGILAVYGNVTPDDFTETALNDPRVVAFASRVTAIADPSLATTGFPARVSVTTKTGAMFQVDVPAQRGSSANPMTPAEHREKFIRNVEASLRGDADAALQQLENLWEARNIRQLTTATVDRRRDGKW